MNDQIREALIAGGFKLSLTCTGLGMTYSRYFTEGTSKWLHDFHVPYSQEASDELTSTQWEDRSLDPHYVSYQQATFLQRIHAPKIISIAVTGAGPTDRERRGADQVYVHGYMLTEAKNGVESIHRDTVLRVVFKKGSFSREAAEEATLQAIDLVLMGLLGLEIKESPLTINGMPQRIFSPQWDGEKWRFLKERNLRELLNPDKKDLPRKCFIPVTVNPFHQGHWNLVKYAETIGLRPVILLSAKHPIKGNLDPYLFVERSYEISAVASMFDEAPLYTDKFLAHPDSDWIIGSDAWNRIWTWGQDHDFILDTIHNTNSTIHVCIRPGHERLEQRELITSAFTGIDISSTAIRERFSLGG